MILLGTTYRTITNEVTANLQACQAVPAGLNLKLAAATAFEISLWADPEDELLQVVLKNEQEFFHGIILPAKPDIRIRSGTIQSDCNLVTDFEQAIYFYSALEKFGEFSNFAPFGFEYENYYYPTVEHFYQSQKFIDETYVALIRQAKTPKAAADLGKNKDKVMKPNWAAIKDEVM